MIPDIPSSTPTSPPLATPPPLAPPTSELGPLTAADVSRIAENRRAALVRKAERELEDAMKCLKASARQEETDAIAAYNLQQKEKETAVGVAPPGTKPPHVPPPAVYSAPEVAMPFPPVGAVEISPVVCQANGGASGGCAPTAGAGGPVPFVQPRGVAASALWLQEVAAEQQRRVTARFSEELLAFLHWQVPMKPSTLEKDMFGSAPEHDSPYWALMHCHCVLANREGVRKCEAQKHFKSSIWPKLVAMKVSQQDVRPIVVGWVEGLLAKLERGGCQRERPEAVSLHVPKVEPNSRADEAEMAVADSAPSVAPEPREIGCAMASIELYTVPSGHEANRQACREYLDAANDKCGMPEGYYSLQEMLVREQHRAIPQGCASAPGLRPGAVDDSFIAPHFAELADAIEKERVAKDVHNLWLSHKASAKSHASQMLTAEREAEQFRFAACKWCRDMASYELHVQEQSQRTFNQRQVVSIWQGRQQLTYWLQCLVRSLKRIKELHQLGTRQQRSKQKSADLRTSKVFCQLHMCNANLHTSWNELRATLEDAAENDVYAQPYSAEVLPHIAKLFSAFPVLTLKQLQESFEVWKPHASVEDFVEQMTATFPIFSVVLRSGPTGNVCLENVVFVSLVDASSEAELWLWSLLMQAGIPLNGYDKTGLRKG